jgi:hypothetical protein
MDMYQKNVIQCKSIKSECQMLIIKKLNFYQQVTDIYVTSIDYNSN